jgi:putative photosynthetic complex assembly protein 2
MGELLPAAAYGLFVWWFSTGVVLLLDNLPRRTHRISLAAGSIVAAVALVRLHAVASDGSEAGAYAAFTYAVLAWAWLEMSFFMGVVTGPRRIGADPGAGLALRFRQGVAASLWHELAIVATALYVVAVSWGAANQVGLWTFVVLWTMRTSAKLNVFLGVRNLGEAFLPPHLQYLLTYMARRPMNLLMPVSLTAGTVGAVLLVQAALATHGAAQAGLSMLATMLALAVIEHWFLILPLPFERLWAWSLRSKAQRCGTRGTNHGLPALLP